MMADPIARDRHRRPRSAVFWTGIKPLFLLILAVLVILPLSGCGRKNLPVPPEGEKLPPPVSDLAGKMEGGMLNLSWTVPATTDRHPLPAAGFNVRAYRQSLGEPCSNCPPNYKTIGRLKVLGVLEEAAGTQVMRYAYPLDFGYRYTITVISVSSGGTASPESNTITIER